MTGPTRTPRLLKGGLVLMDRDKGGVQRVIVLQYTPDTLTRSLTARGAGEDSDPLEALRLSGPPVETINLEATLDATDALAANDKEAMETGIAADIAALETVLYPTTAQLARQDELAAQGKIEILPAVTPLVLFVWGARRIMPVRITEMSITEEAFDAQLNPILARISLGMRVMTVNDLPYASHGGALSLVQHQLKEALATKAGGSLAALGAGEALQ